MKRSHQQGFTLIEVMIVVAIIALLAAIAIPNVLRGRTTANESASIGNLRALVSSLEMYRSVNNAYPLTDAFQDDMYTNANPDFGPPAFDEDLSAITTVGPYTYVYTGTASTYTLNAAPATPLTTGTRRFHADESGLLRHCNCADADCATSADWSGEKTIDSTADSCG